MANYIQQLKERAELAEQERRDALDELEAAKVAIDILQRQLKDHVCAPKRARKAVYKDGVWRY